MTYANQIERYIDQFPDMPALCQKLVKNLGDPEVDFKKIADTITYDPGLTANILKLANSSYFGAVQKINSLQPALVRLGTKTVLELVISSSVSSNLLYELPGYGLKTGELLKHSIWTAVAAQELAVILDMNRVEMVFTTGLLHDLGMLLLDPYVQQESLLFEKFLENPETSFDQKEREVLGMDHAEAGATILEKWSLGSAIVNGVRWHHVPEKADENQELAYLIHLANMLAFSEGIGAGHYGMQYRVSPKAIKFLGLRKDHIEYASSKTLDKMKELENILI